MPADIEEQVFGSEAEIVTLCALKADEIDDKAWRSADVILAWHEIHYTSDIIEKLVNCKVIVRVGVGYDNVDLAAAGRMGIPVCNVPDYGTNDVADHALGLMLCLARGLNAFNESVRRVNNWDWNAGGELHRISDATLGIIGLGRIGTAVALRAKAFGLQIVFYDPYIPDGQDKALGVRRCSRMDSLLCESDIVSIHTPLTEETKEMANKAFFGSMKQGAIFINTARGAIVDLDALTESLLTDHLKAAGLDVLPTEPPDLSHPLFKAWQNHDSEISNRLIITPHSAFYNKESYVEMRRKAAEEAARVLGGKSPRNCVNKIYL